MQRTTWRSPALRFAWPVAGLVALVVQAHPAVAQAPSAPGARFTLYLPIVSPPQPSVAPLQLSHGRGFYDAPIVLTLTTHTPDATVRYTIDGTPPNDANGYTYDGPTVVGTTTTLRAIATRPGFTPSAIETHTFIFTKDVIHQPDQPDVDRYPPVWGSYPDARYNGRLVEADYEMDPKVVDSPLYRDTIKHDLEAVPSLSLVTTPNDMFAAPGLFGSGQGIYAFPLGEGAAWERPASAELIYPDGRAGFQIDCGVRIAGQWSRKPDSTAKHSFSLRFRKRYGTGKLAFPLFPDTGVRTFNALRLRAGQADALHYLAHRSQYLHDQWGRDTARDMGHLAAHGTFVHLYLNGLYWGLYNLTEEVTADFAAAHLGGDAADFDVIKGAEAITTTAEGETIALPSYEAEDGSVAAFEAMLAIPREGPASDPERYGRMGRALDIPQHIEYTLLEIYGANDDWLNKNWRAIRRRGVGERFGFVVWDIERMIQLLEPEPRCGTPDWPECGNIAATTGVGGLHGWLRGNPDYRQMFADRARRHLSDGGALSPDRAAARYAALAAQIDRAIVGESARWGDVFPQPKAYREQYDVWQQFWDVWGKGRPYLRDLHWVSGRDRLLGTFFPRRSTMVLDQLCAAGLYPPIVAPRIDARPGRGKTTVAWLQADITGPACPEARLAGTIYHTTDGSDPRAAQSGDPAVPWSGRIGPGARPYHAPLRATGFAPIRARLAVPDGDGLLWSALAEAAIGLPRVALSELMYHPVEGDAEFIELHNLEPVPVDLSGATLEGVDATLPAGTVIGPDGYLVLTDDAAQFDKRHPGVAVAATYLGNLSNSDETIALDDASGRRLAAVTYRDDAFWPIGADGHGYSLVLTDPAGDPADPERWRASARRGGSPGAADPDPPYREPVLNEVLAHAEWPLEAAIELFNPGTEPADIGGWFLSDDRDDVRKFGIAEHTVIPPGGYAVIYADALRSGGSPPSPGPAAARSPGPAFDASGGQGSTPPGGGRVGAGFVPHPDGGSVYLSSADPSGDLTGSIRGVAYGAADEGVSWGRHRTRAGPDFVAQVGRTFGVDEPPSVEAFRTGTGLPNAGPRVGPVVISEILYAPRGSGDAFVELHNITDAEIPLYDAAGPDDAWRFAAGVSFVFPPGATIPAGGRVIVAGAEPRWFRFNPGNAALAEGVPVFGPFVGTLDPRGETLTLVRPGFSGAEDGAEVSIEVDRVRYRGGPPWPALAAGRGTSLERRVDAAYGNDPDNWLALSARGTPGRANAVPRLVYLPWATVEEAD